MKSYIFAVHEHAAMLASAHTQSYISIEPVLCSYVCAAYLHVSSWFELFLACARMPRPTNRRSRRLEEELRALEQSVKSLNVSALKVHEHSAAAVTSSNADPAAAWLVCF